MKSQKFSIWFILVMIYTLCGCTSSKPGKKSDYFSNGTLQRTYTIDANNKRQGIAVQYHPNGRLKSIETYKNDLLEGLVLIYDEEGHLKSKAYYSDDMPNGLSVFYYPSGKPEQVIENREGKELHSKMYYPSGQMKQMRSMNFFDKTVQSIVRFYPDGKIMSNGSHYVELQYVGEDHKSLSAASPYFHEDSLVVLYLESFQNTDNVIRRVRFEKNTSGKVVFPLMDSDYRNGKINILIRSYSPMILDLNTRIASNELAEFKIQLDKGEAPKEYNVDGVY